MLIRARATVTRCALLILGAASLISCTDSTGPEDTEPHFVIDFVQEEAPVAGTPESFSVSGDLRTAGTLVQGVGALPTQTTSRGRQYRPVIALAQQARGVYDMVWVQIPADRLVPGTYPTGLTTLGEVGLQGSFRSHSGGTQVVEFRMVEGEITLTEVSPAGGVAGTFAGIGQVSVRESGEFGAHYAVSGRFFAPPTGSDACAAAEAFATDVCRQDSR